MPSASCFEYGAKRVLTLGAADEQIDQCEDASENSYRSIAVMALAGLAADPWALAAPARNRSTELFRLHRIVRPPQ